MYSNNTSMTLSRKCFKDVLGIVSRFWKKMKNGGWWIEMKQNEIYKFSHNNVYLNLNFLFSAFHLIQLTSRPFQPRVDSGIHPDPTITASSKYTSFFQIHNFAAVYFMEWNEILRAGKKYRITSTFHKV